MVKKQIKKQNRNAKLYLVAIIGLFISVILCATGLFIINSKVDDIREAVGKNDITWFVSEAMNNLTKEAPTASFSNTQFINEMKLQFTNINSASIAYFYTPPDIENNEPESVMLTSVQLKNQADVELRSQQSVEDLFNAIPGTQRCSRLFLLSYNRENSVFYEDYSVVHEKILNDGRTLFIRKTNESPLCRNSNELISDLFETIKTVQSY